jgi:protoporphyrinogen oxidase
MEFVPFAVIGTGMAGLGAAYALDQAGARYTCYDKNDFIGGHARSFRYQNGFVFDDGGHVSFTKNPHVQQILADNVLGAFVEKRLAIDNYWQSHRIPHPVQNNLRYLPNELVVQIIADFTRSRDPAEKTVTANESRGSTRHTYADWLVQAYGRTFARTFPMIYGRKYHTTDMENLTTDWIGPRMYRPTLEELVRSALPGSASIPNYIDVYRYPSAGGFVSYLEPFAKRFPIQLRKQVVSIDSREKVLRFEDGDAVRYGSLISSIPLPDLVSVMVGAPDDVVAASHRLAFTTALIVNLGVDRADLSDAGVTYFYEEDIIFSRINLPHMFSGNNAPDGCGTIQAEIYYSDKYKPLDSSPQELIGRTIRDLQRCKVLRADDSILLADVTVNRYANIIYDFDRAAALSVVHGFLQDSGVRYCGRYGNWDHAWTDQAFVSGEETAWAALG